MTEEDEEYETISFADIEEEEEEELHFKKWFTKIVFLMIILAILTYAIERYIAIKLLVDFMVLFIVILLIFFLHEGLHYRRAIKLGYKPEWYRTKVTMGFDVDFGQTKREVAREHIEEIGKAPYPVCIPLSLVIIIAGFFIGNLGLLGAGILSFVGHLITYKMEGKLL